MSSTYLSVDNDKNKSAGLMCSHLKLAVEAHISEIFLHSTLLLPNVHTNISRIEKKEKKKKVRRIISS
jgi:hypothetical protein